MASTISASHNLDCLLVLLLFPQLWQIVILKRINSNQNSTEAPFSRINRWGNRIVNGKFASSTDHPWTVFLQVHASETAFFVCGGTYWGNEMIVTAKHCLANFKKGYALFGEVNRDLAKSEGVVFTRNQTKMSPETEVDIAVITLKKEDMKAIKKPYKPITHPRPCMIPKNGESVTAVGWGRSCANKECTIQKVTSHKLQEVSIKRTSGGKCVVAEYEFCAGGRVNGKPTDTCEGDSGGTVECENNGKKVFCGVTSRGPEPGKCGTAPGVYVAVGDPKILGFITGEEVTETCGRKASENAEYQSNGCLNDNQSILTIVTVLFFISVWC